MKGLLMNNFYATLSNIRAFSIIMFVSGIFIVAVNNKSSLPIICYMLLSMIGFSFNSIASLRRESANKWSKYKLTTPVKRSAIIQSYFLSILLWLLVGILFAGTGVTLSIILHGFPFDRNADIFMLFVAGVSISLFIGAIFSPLFYLGGEERNEVFLIISVICGVGIVAGIAGIINTLFPRPMSMMQLILGGIIILICALSAFAVSCPVTTYIYQKREY